jgi:hypothetical protein
VPDPLEALDLVDLLTHPRQLRRWVAAQVAQIGFAIVAFPIGCAVFLVTMFLGLGLAGLLLLGLNLDTSLSGLLVFIVLGASVAVTFLVLVRVYRAMPPKVRAMIEMADDGGPTGDRQPLPTHRAAVGVSAEDLAALDARLAPPSEPFTTRR